MARFNVRLKDEQLEKLDSMAKAQGVSRAQMMRLLLGGGVKHPEGRSFKTTSQKKCTGVKHRNCKESARAARA